MLVSRRRLLAAAGLATLSGLRLPTSADAASTAQAGPSTVTPPTQAIPGELRVSLIGEPRTLDPALAMAASELSVLASIFEGLLTYDQDLALTPGLARDVPAPANGGISADGLTYTLRLKGEARWSDGRPVRAQDFEYALRRLLDPRTGSPHAPLYYDIRGARSLHRALEPQPGLGQRQPADLSYLRASLGVRSLDEQTLQITLESRRAAFAHLLALPAAFPVREDLIQQLGAEWTEPGWLQGTGPFRLTQREREVGLTLEPNEHFGGPPPALRRLSWKLSSEPIRAYEGFLDDQVDLAPVPAGAVGLLPAEPGAHGRLVRYPELSTAAIFFDTQTAPFDNQRLRQAIATAVDRDALVDSSGLAGARPAYSWVPPGIPGHDSDAGEQYVFNPNRAAGLLAEAGFPGGRGLPALRFGYPATADGWTSAEWLRLQLRRNLGLELELEPVPPAGYRAAIAGNRLPAWWGRWTADYPDPDNWLTDLFGSGRPGNQTRLADKELDQLIAHAIAEPDDAARLARWQAAERRLMALVPVVPLLHRERVWIARSNVQGLQVTGRDQVPGQWRFWAVSVD